MKMRTPGIRTKVVAVLAAGIVLAGVIVLASNRGNSSGDCQSAVSTLGYQDFLGMVKAGKFPEAMDLPAFYRDPNLFLQEDQRRAQSGFVGFWNGLGDDQKLIILKELLIARDPTFIPFLVEIAYFTLPVETKESIGSGILGALGSCAWRFLDLDVFITNYIAQNAVCPEVSEYAQRDLEGLRIRRQRFGH